jgi:hypothetical protein
MYLRSSTVGTALPRLLSLLTHVAAGRIGASTATAGAVVSAAIMVGAFHVLHGLIVITARWSARKIGDLVLYINILALQQNIDDFSKLQVAGAEPARVAVLMLGVRLHPEQVSLRARGELQDKDPAIRCVPTGWFVGSKAAIRRNHHQVKLGLV